MRSKVPLAVQVGFAAAFITPVIILFGTSASARVVYSELGNSSVLIATWTTVWPDLFSSVILLPTVGLYAWLVNRTDVPGKRFLSLLPFLGLAMPGEVRAIGFVFLLAPRVGMINLAFDNLLHVSFPLFNIYSGWGLVLLHTVGGFPFYYLMFTVLIRGIDTSLEDASLVSGASVFTTIRRVTVPLLVPGMIPAVIASSLVGFSNFDYPFILGQARSAGVNTLATSVFNAVAEDTPPSFSTATALSLIYLMITLVSLVIYVLVLKKGYRYVSNRGTTIPTTYSLGIGRYLGLLYCLIVLVVTIFLAMFIIAYVSFLPFYSFDPSTLARFTLSNYTALFTSFPLFWGAFQTSIILAMVTGIAASFVATFIAYAVIKGGLGVKIFEYFNFLPIAIPGVVYGLALLWTFLYIPVLSRYLYGTNWPLIIALVLAWTPFSVRIIAPSLLQIHDEVEESALLTGAKWTRFYRTVLLPMLKLAFLTSFFYVFLDSFRELGIVILLTTPTSYTLTTFIADLFTSSATQLPVAAATGVIMMLFATAFIIFASKVLHVDLYRSGLKN